MRLVIAGFFLGSILAVLALLLIQRIQIAPVSGELSYHFHTCVFSGTEFPDGDLDNGRILRRALLPLQITRTFYDAHYHEVKQATGPGRYGAVVRINTNASEPVYRFITLYRTPAPLFWDAISWTASSSIPLEFGINPTVTSLQQAEIGHVLVSQAVDEDGNATAEFAVLLAGLSEIPATEPPMVQRNGTKVRDMEWWYGLRQKIGLTPRYQFLTDLPKGYDADPSRRWPLILFLHHAGISGNDLRDVRTCGLAGEINKGRQIPAIVISPQCPENEPWNTSVLMHLLDEMEAKYCVDVDRNYVTGISGGGDEAWALALAHPERFAAVIPMAGDADPADAARLRNLPIWVFHGLMDDVISPSRTTSMVEAIRHFGGHAHMTLVPDAGHDVWDRAYVNDALYEWMLAQKRGKPEVLTPGVPST